MLDRVFTFSQGTTIRYGAGAASLTGEEVRRLGMRRVLLVTDAGVRGAGLLSRIEESLRGVDVAYEIFDGIEEDVDVSTMHRGAQHLKDSGCDGVIAIGGGSVLCGGRGIALDATNGEPVSAFEGRNRYRVPPLPVICVPTTAGSGADISPGFAVHDAGQRRVYGVGGDHIQAPVSILDPLMLLTCPPRQMSLSGIDALSHAMEALWGPSASPLTDALAYESVRLIVENLPEAVCTGSIDARAHQLVACALANMACSNAGFGIVHGMALFYDVKLPHGYQAGVLLPYAMEFNLPACEGKLAALATRLGESGPDLAPSDMARLAVRRIRQLYVDLDFPRSFRKGEIPSDRLSDMIATALSMPFVRGNIRQVSARDVADIYESAQRGWELD